MKLFSYYKDNLYTRIKFLFINIVIKNNKNVIKNLEKEISLFKNKNSFLFLEIKRLIKDGIIKNNYYDIIFIDNDVDITKYVYNYFVDKGMNIKKIKADINFDIRTNTINDLIDILSSKVIVTSAESSAFQYLFENQVIINIWHACGSFKKTGSAAVNVFNEKNKVLYTLAGYNNVCNSKHQYFITSSESTRQVYADSFDLDLDNVLALGQVRTDVFFDKEYIDNIRKNFFNKYPNLRNKKIYLYVPTYRESNSFITTFINFNLSRLSSLMDENEIFIYKLHPSIINIIERLGSNYRDKITNLKEINNNIVDMSNEDIMVLLVISDVILTDYSSAFMEGLLLNKPCVFTANDIDEYERGFYINYRKDLPGEIVESNKAKTLLTSLRKASINHQNYEKFKEYHLGSCDGHSIERVVNFIKTFIDNN